MRNILKLEFIFVCLCFAMTIAAQDNETQIKPIFGMELTSEFQATHKGDYNFANLLRLNAAIPVSGSITFEAASLSTYMTAVESIGGDLMTFSNLDAGNIPFALSMCDVEWKINGNHSLYAGIRNMNEDYFISPVTSLFTNSSCGIFPTISANYPIANYPLASVGMHYKYESENFCAQASFYNGRGFNRFSGRDNVFRVCPKDDGVFGLAQIEYRHNGGIYFLGGCGRDRYDNADSSEVTKPSATLWTYTEQSITNRLSLIAGYSHAFNAVECSDFIGIGGKYSLKRCDFGIFADYAHFAEASEFATEVTCNINITQHIRIQPTVHFIITGSAFCSAAMLRMGISF